MIHIVTDGFWFPPNQGIVILSTGGAPPPCPNPPEPRPLEPYVEADEIKPMLVESSGPPEPEPPQTVHSEPSIDVSNLVPKIAGAWEE